MDPDPPVLRLTHSLDFSQPPGHLVKKQCYYAKKTLLNVGNYLLHVGLRCDLLEVRIHNAARVVEVVADLEQNIHL